MRVCCAGGTFVDDGEAVQAAVVVAWGWTVGWETKDDDDATGRCMDEKKAAVAEDRDEEIAPFVLL